jgi:hypothetical protein
MFELNRSPPSGPNVFSDTLYFGVVHLAKPTRESEQLNAMGLRLTGLFPVRDK